jgi:BolA protein
MIKAQLKDILQKSFQCDLLQVENQSHLHAGHAGSPETGESHFHILVVSNDFDGMGRVQRHQAVNNAISHLFDKGLHACSLTLKSKNEYKGKL